MLGAIVSVIGVYEMYFAILNVIAIIILLYKNVLYVAIIKVCSDLIRVK